MKNLKHYITEAWSGVKKQSLEPEIKSWCDEMGIKKYTINSLSEIDVDGGVKLNGKDFKKLPYKFGTVTGYFSIKECKNLISLKNCPDKVGSFFACSYNQKLDSLVGCPKEVEEDFWCKSCKREFTIQEVKSLCKVKRNIIVA